MRSMDQCECGGRLKIISLNRRERMRRRIGQAMIGKCDCCGTETPVVKKAWLMFVAEKRRRARERVQPSLFQ
jgi:hypothetical protein